MDSKPDPVNRVLSTAEVREMIMKRLDILSLVNCRLVSKSWNTTASSVLKKRPVWIRRAWDCEKFGQLYACVKKSTNFPFRGLDLSITGKRPPSLNFDNVSKLFTSSGMNFTHLRAKCSMTWHKFMLKNLLKKTAQLQYLELGGLPTYGRGEDPEFCLSSLRILKFGGIFDGKGERVLEQLISSAPHLNEIQDVHCQSAVQMTAIRNTRKFDLVSSMMIADSVETHICSELIANPPRLTALTVAINEHPTRHFIVALKALLTQNARTLKKLEFRNFPEQLDDLPVFHKLEKLTFKIDNDTWRLHASMSAALHRLSSSSFPTLKKIQLDATDAEITERTISDHFWEVCETPLETVNTLELESYCGPEAIKYLAKCFPQVTYISLNYQQSKYGRANRPDSNIWLLHDFTNLSKLDMRGHPFKYGIMDRFLTGIPKEIVAKLRTAPRQDFTPFIVEILRTHGNTLQLKNLKEFTVTIIPSSSGCKPSIENPFMTMVSIWYALELIPGLRANFLCCSKSFKCIVDHSEDFQKAFQPVKDFVTVGQCFCDAD